MAGIGDRAIGIMGLLGFGGMADNKEEEQGGQPILSQRQPYFY